MTEPWSPRDEEELAQAHRLAAEIPPWFEEQLPDDPASARLHELHAPLDAGAEARIVERAVDGYLRADAAGATPPNVLRPRRWRPTARSLAGAAAAVAAMVLVVVVASVPANISPSARLNSEELPGAVRLMSAVRGAEARDSLRVEPGGHVLLACRGDGRAVTVVGARAVPAGSSGEAEVPHWLGWTAVTVEADGATLQVHADLPAGDWDVTCQVHVTSSGRLALLDPARLLVR